MKKWIAWIVVALFLALIMGSCLVAASEPVELPPTPTPTPIPTPTVRVAEFRTIELYIYQFFPWHAVTFTTPDGKFGRVGCIQDRAFQISCDVPDSEPMYIEVWVVDEGIPIVDLIAPPPCPHGGHLHLHKDHPLCH